MTTIITITATANDIQIVGLDAITGVELAGYGGIVKAGKTREFEVDNTRALRIQELYSEVTASGEPALRPISIAGSEEVVHDQSLREITFMPERKAWVYVESGEDVPASEIPTYVASGQITTGR